MSISDNLADVYQKIEKHKITETATLVAVSKYSEYQDIEEAYLAGQKDFGENRIDSLMGKALLAQEKGHQINWHFIGNIQSNKIKEIVEVPGLIAIHSIDSIKHLKKFYQLVSTPIKFFIQFNTSDEDQKGGLKSLEDFQEFKKLMDENQSSSLSFEGLMTMGKLRTDNQERDAKICFEKLAEIRNQINPELSLSMGMSSDYELALSCGSDYIRVGSSIFK